MRSSCGNRLIENKANLSECSKIDDSGPLEAAFLISGNTQLNLNSDGWHDKAAEFLDHAVSKNPVDLLSHIQRINLFRNENDASALFGAVLDLFIALNEQGRPLRERMLNASRNTLDDEKYRFLAEHLETGIKATDQTIQPNTSVLTKGVTGSNRIVEKTLIDVEAEQHPLEAARDYLEYGEIEEARKVLEKGIMTDLMNLDLHHDLLEIYKRTGAKKEFQKMYHRLRSISDSLPREWLDLKSMFKKEK